MAVKGKPAVLILGGGFGGLEMAFYLRMRLGDRARITVVSDRDRFLFKPNMIYIPFGLDVHHLEFPLEMATRPYGIGFIHAQVRETDPQKKTVRAGDHRLNYDFLGIATGAGVQPLEIPGLGEHALTVWTLKAMFELRDAFHRLLEEAKKGKRTSVLFVVPPNNQCAGPLYEIVLMLDTWLRRSGARDAVNITWTTCEEAYIQAFGPRLHEVITKEFTRRGIEGHNRFVVERVEDRRVIYRNGQELPFDLLVSSPPHVASTLFPALPSDNRGFLRTLQPTRQVIGYPEIYAVGDAGDFPVKQAFLAFLQADAAAEQLASALLGKISPAPFVPNSMSVMEQFDKATFAQVPLRLTGLPERPVEVRPDEDSVYRVGSSRLWRMGKKLQGAYLPWRFLAAKPFHAGLPWKGMDLGLKVMSGLLAR